MVKHWLAAFRLKTLPLALGAIIFGSNLQHENFNWLIFSLAASTAILLQVLSNLANDYGDFKKGTDNHRSDRQLAGGNITPKSMMIAIVVFAVLALVTGIYLLTVSFGDNMQYWLTFFGVGLASIAAAIMYTVGKKAYGYNGLGDVFVFIFFGLVGVLGTSFLFDQNFDAINLLPAIAYGCLCVGVLNVNNIRDLDKDILTNKITLASKMGKSGALNYQKVLVSIALIGLSIHHILSCEVSLAPVGVLLLGLFHIKKLVGAKETNDYNQQLKTLSLGSLAIAVLFLFKLF
jgi:1,4-dihydroxy-2-naphthoate octaprenyltransferase